MRKRHTHPPADGSTKVQQSFEPDTNINVVMDRYRRSGVISGPTGRSPQARRPMFDDFTHTDFQSMLNTVMDVRSQFQTLPPRIRRRFFDDPVQLVRFVNDPANRSEALRLGLVEPTPEEIERDYQLREAARRKAVAKASQGRQEDLVRQSEGSGDPLGEDPESQPRKGGKRGD